MIWDKYGGQKNTHKYWDLVREGDSLYVGNEEEKFKLYCKGGIEFISLQRTWGWGSDEENLDRKLYSYESTEEASLCAVGWGVLLVQGGAD